MVVNVIDLDEDTFECDEKSFTAFIVMGAAAPAQLHPRHAVSTERVVIQTDQVVSFCGLREKRRCKANDSNVQSNVINFSQ